MSNQNIYQKVKEIADALCEENKTYLRADLAFELKKYGIMSDSSDVSKLVYEAYEFYRHDGNIAIAFVSNNSRTTLVNEYKLNASLEQGHVEDALKMAETEIGFSSSALNKLQGEIDANLNLVLAKGASKMADVVMGTNGVKSVKEKASTMFGKYTKMVEAYHYAEDSVRSNIDDFTSLRGEIEATYRDYAMKLIDIYGDSIKMVSPELFDFNRIEWLDVDDMLKYVELEYNKIQDKCAVLIGEISDSFRASLQSSLAAYKSVSNGNKSIGLAMAGLEMLNHYMVSSEKTNRLKSDLSVLQTSVKHDATRIKADMGRLLVICKTLRDIVIPKSYVYLRFAGRLMDTDLKKITDSLYANAEVRPLAERRAELLRQMKALDVQINDHLQNIDVYSSLIADITSMLSSKRPNYMDAKSKKPSKPFFLLNWLTFGTANKNYYREYSEWDAVCMPLIREYEDNQVDLKLDKEELASHQESLKALKSQHSKLAAQLNEVSMAIRKKVVCTDDIKLSMLKHLRDIVAMLKLGREIVECKLDENLLHTVEIPDFKHTMKLPEDLEQNLTNFTNILADNLHADSQMAVNLLNGISQMESGHKSIQGGQSKDDEKVPSYSEEDLSMVTAKADEALQQGVALFDSVAKLKLQQIEGKLASAAYDAELQKYSDKFKGCLDKIDNKSAYLREVFRKINLASDEEERKLAMQLLSDLSGYTLSERDFTEFMNGNQQIEL